MKTKSFIEYPSWGAPLKMGTTVAFEGVNYSFYTAENPEEKESVKRCRNNLLIDLGFSHMATLRQIHSDTVHWVTSANLTDYLDNPYIEGDALFTDQKGLLLGVLTADCVPVFYFDKTFSVIAAIHAGRVGIQKGIHLQTLSRLRQEFGIDPESILVTIGVHIRKCCYEIGQEMIRDYDGAFLEKRNGRVFLDMESIIIAELLARGILRENIATHPLCTCCSSEPRFYSYRRGDQSARNLSFIGMLGK